MILAERTVKVPWFAGDAHWFLQRELGPLTGDMVVPPREGDEVCARYVGTVHDPTDGWPLMVYRMTIERN